MDLIEWIRDEHYWIRIMFERDVAKLVPLERLTERAGPNSNSIAWLVWHMARLEDAAVNGAIRQKTQIFYRDTWGPRIGTRQTTQGNNFGDEEMEEFAHLDAGELLAYWQAVTEETIEWLKDLTAEQLSTKVDIPKIVAENPAVLEGVDDGFIKYFTGKDVGYLLRWPVILHGHLHLGEMLAIRGLIGITEN
ncbi:MAG: DinB family protein [Actinomycetota bacterium]|nr:DinB family protein [Actinomycetota bacterium]